MDRDLLPLLLTLIVGITVLGAPEPADAQLGRSCKDRDAVAAGRNPTAQELRCRYGATGPGRFGLISYAEVPVYQPATPMPGTHVIGVAGHARPHLGESYEAWEWRVLRTEYGEDARRVHRDLELLETSVAERIRRLESLLREEGIPFSRRETWRSPVRQAYLFQQGRSRPGPIATATLTSWHSHVDDAGRPSGRAVDYDVPNSGMVRFHEIADAVGLVSFGAGSNDPGHVFVPDEIGSDELRLLRLLPRVPNVTLATGAPVDRPVSADGRRALRDASLAFASETFLPFPTVDLAPAPAPDIVRTATLRSTPIRVASNEDESRRRPRN